MNSSTTIDLFKKFYTDIQFERAGLFKFIKENYDCTEVLYPGSFIHVTPSFFFPYVVYVDQSPIASKFFADQASVLQYINRNKTYKRSAYVQYLAHDYFSAMPLAEGQFDLLLSLYASGISHACKKYLKVGGILVTNNFHEDARVAAFDSEFQLISVMRYSKKSYIITNGVSKYFTDAPKKPNIKKYVRQTSQRIEFTEPDDYFFFKKCLSPHSSCK